MADLLASDSGHMDREETHDTPMNQSNTDHNVSGDLPVDQSESAALLENSNADNVNAEGIFITQRNQDGNLGESEKRKENAGQSLTQQKHVPKVQEEDLGIYDDVAVCDDLSDLSNSEIGEAPEPEPDDVSDRESVPENKPDIDLGTSEVKASQQNNESAVQETQKVLDRPSTRDDASSLMTLSAAKPVRVSIRDLRQSGRRSGARGKSTTPASFITEYTEYARNASRLTLESREAMFRRAMTLLSTRCTSIGQGLESVASGGDAAFSFQFPQYIYIRQEKPTPMPPLKAWRGYNGNVYFSPLEINPVKAESQPGLQSENSQGPAMSKCSERLQQILMTKKRRAAGKAERENVNLPDSRSVSRQTNKTSSTSTSNYRPATRQMVLLDKNAVLTRFNENLQEDLTWLEGMDSTGGLAIRPRSERTPRDPKETKQVYNKERICRGSVVHKLYVENKGRKKPKLAVSGGKFTPPTSMSPLLRTQTQYSNSNHRLTTNSPDPYHLEGKLPHLEQIRISLKQDSKALVRAKTYTRPVTMTDELKPFVKYSPDIIAKFGQQANIC